MATRTPAVQTEHIIWVHVRGSDCASSVTKYEAHRLRAPQQLRHWTGQSWQSGITPFDADDQRRSGTDSPHEGTKMGRARQAPTRRGYETMPKRQVETTA